MPISTFSLLASCDDHWHCTCLQSCRLSWYWRGHWWHCGCWHLTWRLMTLRLLILTWTLMTLRLLTSDMDIDDTAAADIWHWHWWHSWWWWPRLEMCVRFVSELRECLFKMRRVWCMECVCVTCRYHVFLQLKKDIVDGRLVPPLKSAAILASYAAQCQ